MGVEEQFHWQTACLCGHSREMNSHTQRQLPVYHCLSSDVHVETRGGFIILNMGLCRAIRAVGEKSVLFDTFQENSTPNAF